MSDEGCARASFQDAVLSAAEWAGWFVLPELLDGSVFIAVVQDGAVIGTKDDQGFFRQIEPVQRLHEFADAPVELNDGVASEAKFCLALESLVGHSRNVEVVRAEEEEERFVLVLFDPGDRLLDPLVGQILVPKPSRMAAGVESDTADAVVDGGIVAVRPIHFERVAVSDAGGVVGAGFLSADPQRIGRVEIQDVVILYVDLRYAVVGRR